MEENKTIELSKEQFENLKALSDRIGPEPVTMTDVAQMNRMSSHGQRSKAQRYEDFMVSYDAMKTSGDKTTTAAFNAANAEMKAIQPGTVHQDATLSNVSIQYGNEMYIGHELLPVVQVAKESDTFYTYPRGERLQYPDDALGTRGRANEISESRSTDTYTCLPRGFSNYVAQRTLNNQDAPLDEMVDLVEAINEGLDYKEEQRCATLLSATGTFGSGQFTTLTGTDRWGNPIEGLDVFSA